MNNEKLLSVCKLRTYFYTSRGIVRAVDGINLEVGRGEIHGIVGESGSGKSVTGLSIMRLVPQPGKIVEGKITFEGVDLLQIKEKEMAKYRGRRISMVFQDPSSSLNPTFTVGDQLVDTIRNYEPDLDKVRAREKALELLNSMGINDPEVRMRQYPFQLSGGMKQRVMIALAMAGKPELIIADEPTTNLDVTVQAQILDLFEKIRSENGISIILITHNIGIVATWCDTVSVMYAGKIMESGNVETVLKKPKHPYTQSLIDSFKSLVGGGEVLVEIQGEPPDLRNPPPGCCFHPRCSFSQDICRYVVPELTELDTGRFVSCLMYQEKVWKKE
jgi:oligopeptide/dipeptide ABC transporter ATP-binding protein